MVRAGWVERWVNRMRGDGEKHKMWGRKEGRGDGVVVREESEEDTSYRGVRGKEVLAGNGRGMGGRRKLSR